MGGGRMLRGMRVGVTGAGGFVASHLIERLVHEGAKVRAFVRYNSRGDIGNLVHVPAVVRSQIELTAGSLLDVGAVHRFANDLDVIFHLGAVIAIPYSYIHPREVIETNVIGTLNVLEASRAHNVQSVVHTSTSEVYGTAVFAPIDEGHPLHAQSPYSASKIGADKIAESYYAAFGLPVRVIRPFNTYGPRQSARAVIPTIISQALAGNRVVLGNFAPTRDFTFVTDTVDGFIRIWDCDDAIGKVVNIGSGSEISIGDLVLKVGEILGRALDLVRDESRLRPEKSEVNRLVADSGVARSILGWSPSVSFEEGLMATTDWIKHNLSRFKIGEYEV